MPPPQPNATQSRSSLDFDVLATRYGVTAFWVREIVLLLHTGATDAEVLADLQNPVGDEGSSAQTIPLSDGQCHELLGDLKNLMTRTSV
jgi:hypothetical protein